MLPVSIYYFLSFNFEFLVYLSALCFFLYLPLSVAHSLSPFVQLFNVNYLFLLRFFPFHLVVETRECRIAFLGLGDV
jgi:hypothetical protein